MKKTNNNLNQKYSKTTIVTHWLSALLILVLTIQGFYMKDLVYADKTGLVKLHAIMGAFLLLINIPRFFSLFIARRPDHLETGSPFNDKLIIWIHNGLYFLIFSIIISGISTTLLGGYAKVIQTGLVDNIIPSEKLLPLQIHSIMSILITVLVFIHVVGFFKHWLIQKENTLKRIL